MNRGCSLVLALVAASLPVRAYADENRGTVAVLPFDFRQAQMDEAAKITLTESVRTVAADALGPAGFTVLTGDNTLAILQDNGIDPNKACESSCALSAARELKASLFISATVATTEGTHLVFVRLFEVKKGSQLASVQLQGQRILDLKKQFEERAEGFFRRVLVEVGAAPRETGGTERSLNETGGGFQLRQGQKSIVKFESSPPGAVVLVDGEMLCQSTPCSKALSTGVHQAVMQRERYQAARQEFNTSSGTVRLELAPRFGTVSVETTPPGLPVTINGEAMSDNGREVDPGEYDVVVDSPCYKRAGEHVVIKSGDSRTLKLVPQPREGGIDVTATDASGNDVEASVSVDNNSVGRAPGAFKVSICAKEVEVALSDGRQWTGSLSLQENQVVSIKAQFQAASTPTPPPGPETAGEATPTTEAVAVEEVPAVPAPAPEVEVRAPEHKRDVGTLALRGGLSPLTGVLGIGAELRIVGFWGVALGTGTYALSGGTTFNFADWTPLGGPYANAFVVLSQSYLLPSKIHNGWGVGATVGWDWRFVPWLSVQSGIGAAYNTADTWSKGAPPLAWDLAVGPVF